MPWGLIECWAVAPDGSDLVLVQVPEDHPLRRRLWSRFPAVTATWG